MIRLGYVVKFEEDLITKDAQFYEPSEHSISDVVFDNLDEAKKVKKAFLDVAMPLDDGFSEEERNGFANIISVEV